MHEGYCTPSTLDASLIHGAYACHFQRSIPNYLLTFLSGLLNTPSPTGLAEPAIAFTEQALAAYPELSLKRTRKGALVATWHG